MPKNQIIFIFGKPYKIMNSKKGFCTWILSQAKIIIQNYITYFDINLENKYRQNEFIFIQIPIIFMHIIIISKESTISLFTKRIQKMENSSQLFVQPQSINMEFFEQIQDKNQKSKRSSMEKINDQVLQLASRQSTPQIYKKTKRILEQWTFAEQKTLYEQYSVFGPKWSIISQVVGKSVNTIKNKFYGRIRKLLRRLAFVGKKQTSTKKSIVYESLIRPLEANNFSFEPFQNFYAQRNGIINDILQYSRNQPENLEKQLAQDLIDRVHRFNTRTRSYKFTIDKNQNAKLIKNKPLKNKKKDEVQTDRSSLQCQNFDSTKQKGQEFSFKQNECQLQLMDDEKVEQLFRKTQHFDLEKSIEDEAIFGLNYQSIGQQTFNLLCL